MQERRDIPRWQIEKNTTITCEGSDDPIWGKVHDINLKGMQLRLASRLPVEQPVRMRVVVDQELCFEVKAHIPWSRKMPGEHMYGISFQGLLDTDRDRIYTYVSTRCSEQFRQHWWEA